VAVGNYTQAIKVIIFYDWLNVINRESVSNNRVNDVKHVTKPPDGKCFEKANYMYVFMSQMRKYEEKKNAAI
jgi:hypothetical protein